MSETEWDYPARVTVLWCDDVRREMFGKTTLVGLYAVAMGISVQKQTLSKLCAAFVLDLPRDASDTVKLEVFNRAELVANQVLRLSMSAPPHPAFARRTHFVQPVEMPGYTVEHGTSLVAVATVGDAEVFRSAPFEVVCVDLAGAPSRPANTPH